VSEQQKQLLYAAGAIALIAIAYEVNPAVGLSLAGLALLAMVVQI